MISGKKMRAAHHFFIMVNLSVAKKWQCDSFIQAALFQSRTVNPKVVSYEIGNKVTRKKIE